MQTRFAQCTLLAACMAAAHFACAQSTATDAHATLLEWVKTEKLIAEEAADWRKERALLESMIQVLSRESSQIKAQMDDLENSIADSTAKIQEFADDEATIQAEIQSISQWMPEWESQAIMIADNWPSPLQSELAPLPALDSLDKQDRWLPRLSAWIGRLRQADEFNRRVTIHVDVDSFPDGKSWEVSEIYFGLGGGFWLTRNAQRAGWLEPSSDGWQRQESTELGPLTQSMIAIAERKRPADYLETPVNLD